MESFYGIYSAETVDRQTTILDSNKYLIMDLPINCMMERTRFSSSMTTPRRRLAMHARPEILAGGVRFDKEFVGHECLATVDQSGVVQLERSHETGS